MTDKWLTTEPCLWVRTSADWLHIKSAGQDVFFMGWGRHNIPDILSKINGSNGCTCTRVSAVLQFESSLQLLQLFRMLPLLLLSSGAPGATPEFPLCGWTAEFLQLIHRCYQSVCACAWVFVRHWSISHCWGEVSKPSAESVCVEFLYKWVLRQHLVGMRAWWDFINFRTNLTLFYCSECVYICVCEIGWGGGQHKTLKTRPTFLVQSLKLLSQHIYIYI